MKRFLFLTLAMLTSAVGAWADHWTYTPPGGQYSETVVEAKLVLSPMPDILRGYEVAAFIDGELRAVAYYGTINPLSAQTPVGDYNYFYLNVLGNFDANGTSDDGKTITFKLFNGVSEFELTPNENITFDAAHHGSPSSPVEMSTNAWSLSLLNDGVLRCNPNDELIDYIKNWYEVVPASDDAPAVHYALGPNSEEGVLSVSDTSIKALKSGLGYVEVSLDGYPEITTTIEVDVMDWITGVKANPKTLTVTYFDYEFDIFDQVSSAMTFSPTDASGFYELKVTSSNPDVVAVDIETSDAEMLGTVSVKGVGEATLTFTLKYPNYLKSEPNKPVYVSKKATLKIVVEQGLVSLEVPQALTVKKDEPFDLTTVIKPLPEGAPIDYSKVTYEYLNSMDYLKIENNILTGLQVCEGAYVGVGYTDLPNFYAPMYVTVINPATALVVNTPVITVDQGDSKTLTDLLSKAVSTVPEESSDKIVWVSTNTDIVAKSDVAGVWDPIAPGTVEMRAEIRDYLSMNGFNDDYTVRLQITITVKVLPLVSSITVDSNYEILTVEVNQDFMAVLNKIITVEPAEASNKKWTIDTDQSNFSTYFDYDGTSITAKEECLKRWTPIFISIVSESNPDVTATVGILGRLQARQLGVNPETLKVDYYGQAADLSSDFANWITILPAFASTVNATVTSSNEDVVTVSATFNTKHTSGQGFSQDFTYDAKAVGKGKATITVTLSYTDYVLDITEPEEDHTVTIKRTFDVEVNVPINYFDYALDESYWKVGLTKTLTLTPNPANADIDLDAFNFEFHPEDLPEGWPYIIVGKPVLQKNGTVTVDLLPTEPGQGYFQFSYDDGVHPQLFIEQYGSVNVGVPTTLVKGWQWKTLWGMEGMVADEQFPDHCVDEIRSQTDMMALDAELGYYGDIYNNGLEANVAYKINALKAVGIEEAPVQFFGEYVVNPREQSLLKSWTWIPYPYYHYFTLSQLAGNGLTGKNGDRIVSKNDGFAEYGNGKWTGTLKGLNPWEAYLYYSISGDDRSFTWQAESNLPVPTDGSGVGGSRSTTSVGSSWKYDDSRFCDNMSMVAKVDGLTDADNYTIGAFVDGECRGEGRCIDGLMFITVHAKSGEQISFRLRNEQTGEEFDIEQTLRFSMLQGSIQSPVRLSSPSFATGFNAVQSSEFRVNSYDLSGRAVDSTQKGVVLQKQSNGTVKKVVVK